MLCEFLSVLHFIVLLCIAFLFFFFSYTLIILLLGICTPCICSTLYNVFMHYMVFLLGVLLSVTYILKGFFFFVFSVCCKWGFLCISKSCVYLFLVFLGVIFFFFFCFSPCVSISQE